MSIKEIETQKIGGAIKETLKPILNDIQTTLKAREIYQKLSIDRSLRGHIALVRNKQVIIRAEDSASATRLRYSQNKILSLLQIQGIDVVSIKILSQPNMISVEGVKP